MNNRFVFRIWDKEAKRIQWPMHIPNQMGSSWCDPIESTYEDGEKTFYETCPPNPGIIEDYIIMQCTGLKDKNGKLIFEGDIIKTGEGYENIWEVSWSVMQACWMGSNYCSNLCLIGEGVPMYQDKDTGYWDCEIIGNIWENFNLLK